VGAGLKWSDLVPETIALGATPPVLTGYIGLSVGGTLSVGGISPTLARGAQVDYVRELDVVTGTGDLVTCSPGRHGELFLAALGGLGQCGIITRAVFDLVPASPMTRNYTLNYSDGKTFFADFRTLLARGELDDVYNFGVPDGAGGWIYQLTAAKHFDPASPPDDPWLFRGLQNDLTTLQGASMPYIAYTMRVDGLIDSLKANNLWDGVLHPWFDVFLPDHTVEQYVREVTPTLTPEDVGPFGFMLLLPKRRSLLRRPLLRVPDAREWVFLFDILTSAAAPGPDPAFEARMLARNRRLFEKARRAGGVRYPIGSVSFGRMDWLLHYREMWTPFLAAKLRFDRQGILTPGPQIFC
jgi:cytokinin dehydrogenase